MRHAPILAVACLLLPACDPIPDLLAEDPSPQTQACAPLAAGDPPTSRLEHRAAVSDGRYLVVTSPADPKGYEGFRIFLGPPSGILERTPTSYARTKGSPGTDLFAFDLDGGSASVAMNNGPEGAGEITLSDQSKRTITSVAALPEGSRFLCLAR